MKHRVLKVNEKLLIENFGENRRKPIGKTFHTCHFKFLCLYDSLLFFLPVGLLQLACQHTFTIAMKHRPGAVFAQFCSYILLIDIVANHHYALPKHRQRNDTQQKDGNDGPHTGSKGACLI